MITFLQGWSFSMKDTPELMRPDHRSTQGQYVYDEDTRSFPSWLNVCPVCYKAIMVSKPFGKLIEALYVRTRNGWHLFKLIERTLHSNHVRVLHWISMSPTGLDYRQDPLICLSACANTSPKRQCAVPRVVKQWIRRIIKVKESEDPRIWCLNLIIFIIELRNRLPFNDIKHSALSYVQNSIIEVNLSVYWTSIFQENLFSFGRVKLQHRNKINCSLMTLKTVSSFMNKI